MISLPFIIILTACGDCPSLPDVPVRSALPEEERTIRAALREMDQLLALPVCVDHVRVGGVQRDDVLGRYNVVTRGVRISANASPGLLDDILRHEVCHAVDLQHDLVAGCPGCYGPPVTSNVTLDAKGDNEAFAVACAPGEALLTLWSSSCANAEFPGHQRVRSVVFGVSNEPAAAATFRFVAGHPSPGVDYFSITPTMLGNLQVFAFRGAEQSTLVLDPWTGAPVWDDDSSPLFTPLEAPDPPPGWTVRGDAHGGPLGDGGLVLATLPLFYGEVQRTHAWTGEAWAPVDGPCPSPMTQVFTFDGELWSAQLENGSLIWGRWEML